MSKERLVRDDGAILPMRDLFVGRRDTTVETATPKAEKKAPAKKKAAAKKAVADSDQSVEDVLNGLEGK